MKQQKETYSIKITPSQTKGKWNYTAITSNGTENHYNLGRIALADKLVDLLIDLKVGDVF